MKKRAYFSIYWSKIYFELSFCDFLCSDIFECALLYYSKNHIHSDRIQYSTCWIQISLIFDAKISEQMIERKRGREGGKQMNRSINSVYWFNATGFKPFNQTSHSICMQLPGNNCDFSPAEFQLRIQNPKLNIH